MSYNVALRVSCDGPTHDPRDNNLPVTPRSVQIGDGERRGIDLCDACTIELLQPLEKLLLSSGYPVRRRRGIPDYLCRECGVWEDSAAKLELHTRRVHQRSREKK